MASPRPCTSWDDSTGLSGGYVAGAAVAPPPDADEEATTVSAETAPDVSAEEGHQMVEDGALLLDVREADEWEAGHSPDAIWIPFGDLQGRVAELPPDRRIVAICRTGSRSRAVAVALVGAGYDAVNVDGGMRAWSAEDFPVVASDGLPGVII
jgi:rhodanese-related sulfurtransferase